MRSLFRRYLKLLENCVEFSQYSKMYLAECIALQRKRKLINTVIWSKSQQEEFDNYWKTHYKKIPNKGTRLIQSFNGKYNLMYIPDFLFATNIEFKLNSYHYSRIYSDKALLDILYQNKSEALLPETILLNSHGILYDKDRHVINKEKAKELLKKKQTIIVKPTVGGSSGKGVILAQLNEAGCDIKQNFNVLDLIREDNKNFIVQQKIEQSEELNQLYPNSINTFRVITFIADSKVHLAPMSLRIGSGGSYVDNIHAGGLAVGIDKKNRQLMKEAYQLGYSDSKKIYLQHPDTGVYFENFKITGLDKVMSSAKRLHEFTPNTNIISWDFTINENYQPLLIEANYVGQSAWFNQITTGESLFGDYTDSILNSIR